MVLSHIKSAAIVAVVSAIVQYIGNLWLVHQFGVKVNIGGDLFDKAFRDWEFYSPSRNIIFIQSFRKLSI